MGPVVTALTQLGAVPLFLHFWGVTKYGEWLVLSAIPSYLSFCELGFGDASGSDMTVRVAAGDRQGALCTFQSSWALLLVTSAIALLFGALTVGLIPWTAWLHLSTVSNRDAAWVVFLFGAYILAIQQTGVLESGYRCDGNYSAGTFYMNIFRLVETVGGVLVGIWTGSFVALVATYLLLRLPGIAWYRLLLKRYSPWLSMGFFRKAKWTRVKQLSKPALGFVVMPSANALSIQGFTVMIGVLLGPVSVAAFTTLRTLTRMNFQFVTTLGFTIWPELSSAFGSGNLLLARKLHRAAYRIGMTVSLLTSCALWVLGPFVYRLWMHNAIPFDSRCFNILILVTIANSNWYLSSVVPMSTNGHHRIALIYFAMAATSVALAYGLVNVFGIVGAALSLLFVDLGMCAVVLRITLKQLQDPFSEFFASHLQLRDWLPSSLLPKRRSPQPELSRHGAVVVED